MAERREVEDHGWFELGQQPVEAGGVGQIERHSLTAGGVQSAAARESEHVIATARACTCEPAADEARCTRYQHSHRRRL